MKMSKPKEISTLYRTFAPTFNSYFPDGDGRDTYIAYNNGGFWNNRIPAGTPIKRAASTSSCYRFRSNSRQTAPFRYYSDGSGRDMYILCNSGGLKRDSKPLGSFHLKDFLRSPSDCALEYVGLSNRKKRFFSRDERKVNQFLRKKEQGVIDRLYNQEKFKFLPGM